MDYCSGPLLQPVLLNMRFPDAFSLLLSRYILRGYNKSVEEENWDDARIAIIGFKMWQITGFIPDAFLEMAPIGAVSNLLRSVNNEEFIRHAIDVMTRVKNKEKFAGKLIKKYGYDFNDFPEVWFICMQTSHLDTSIT